MEILNKPEILNIIQTVRQNHWNTDYAARYVVVSISRLVKRDPKFFLSPEVERIYMFQNMNYESDYPNVICKTLHELIRDVLDVLGIKSTVVKATNTTIPLFALIIDGEHNRYFVDALHDLFRSQYNVRPIAYGAKIRSKTSIIDDKKEHLVDLPLDYVREIDVNTGLIPGEYFSDEMARERLKLVDRNVARKIFGEKNTVELLKKKISYVSDKYLNVYPVHGPIERTGLHVYLRNTLFNNSEKEKFYVGNRIDKEGNPVYVLITYGVHNFTYEEVFKDNKYSLQETAEAIAPRIF